MKKLCSWITEHTGLVLVVFLILTVVCAALKPLIGDNYDMNDYLPPDSAALFSVTIAEEKRIDACSAIREIIGDDNAMAGSAVSTAVATTSTVTEIPLIAVAAVNDGVATASGAMTSLKNGSSSLSSGAVFLVSGLFDFAVNRTPCFA